MSGQRYDYEIVSGRCDDYLLRSELGRAMNATELDKAEKLFSQLCRRTPDTPTNRQYLLLQEAILRTALPQDRPDWISPEEEGRLLEALLALTLPLDPGSIDTWPTSSLAINETMALYSYAIFWKKQNRRDKSLSILSYVKRCLENTGADVSYYEDLYTRFVFKISSCLGDLGHYRESDRLVSQCMEMSLAHQNSDRLALYFYSDAWNLEQQFPRWTGEERRQKKQGARALLRQAYAAALISGDRRGQQHILAHYVKKYGIELEL